MSSVALDLRCANHRHELLLCSTAGEHALGLQRTGHARGREHCTEASFQWRAGESVLVLQRTLLSGFRRAELDHLRVDARERPNLFSEVFQARGFAGSHDPTGHLSHPDPKKVGGFVGRPVEVMLHSSLHTRHVSVRGADIDGGKRHGFVQRHQRAFSPRAPANAPACRR